MKHTNDGVCPSCEEKLKLTHPKMVEWYRGKKAKYADLHIAHSWRSKEEQDQFYKDGRSKQPWPHSPHNYMIASVPCSKALDLFQLDSEGKARFERMYYSMIILDITDNNEPIKPGAVFVKLKDYNHFQLED